MLIIDIKHMITTTSALRLSVLIEASSLTLNCQISLGGTAVTLSMALSFNKAFNQARTNTNVFMYSLHLYIYK